MIENVRVYLASVNGDMLTIYILATIYYKYIMIIINILLLAIHFIYSECIHMCIFFIYI